MGHHFVPVDFASLMDSIGIANERGDRIRLSDRKSFESFMKANGLEEFRIKDFVAAHRLPMATIISSGLMKGLYVYSAGSREAFVYIASDRDFAPLRRYSDEICFDLALSYASEERSLVLLLKAELESHGVSVYLVDVEEAPDEPLWSIRFREGLFYSRFFVPFLTEHYLARGGTAVELFDIARATVAHRAEEFFYPLIALVRDASEIPHLVFSQRGSEAQRFDTHAFEWVRTHAFSVQLSQGIPWLARFFASLARNARGVRDSDFLDCLGSLIDWVEFGESPSLRYAKLLIRNPALTYHHFVMFSNGGVKYYGMGEPTPAARRGCDFPDLPKAVLDWLAGEAPAFETRPKESQRADTPTAPKGWFCPNCHHEGPPVWKKLGDPERLRDLGIVLRHQEGLPLCGKCGRTTMIER
ncbi:MAG TPA: toll/interleukin-1 receptor domain-containing protein [Thermoanaerobaculia bacterium]